MTIFTKIIRGEIPSHRVYEDDHVYAFLDIAPLSEGHTLVVPKEEVATLDQLSNEAAAAIGRALPKVCRALMQATGAKEYNILQNNGPMAHQAVFHVHFHVIPKFPDAERASKGEGLGLRWPAGKLDQTKAKDLAARIASAIG